MKLFCKTLLTLSVILLFSNPAIGVEVSYYSFITGDDLYEMAKTWRQMVENNGMRTINEADTAGYYAGYVSGIVSVAQNLERAITVNLPKSLSVPQSCNIVYEYLDEHPDEFDDGAPILVLKALNDAFKEKDKEKQE